MGNTFGEPTPTDELSFDDNQPTNTKIPVQHTFFYTCFGRKDHIKNFNSVLAYQQFSRTHDPIFGTHIISPYGRQLLRGIKHNAIIDQMAEEMTPQQLHNEYGLDLHPHTYHLPTSTIDPTLILPNTNNGNGNGDVNLILPTHIPFTILSQGPSIIHSQIQSNSKAPQHFQYQVHNPVISNKDTVDKQKEAKAQRQKHQKYSPIGLPTSTNPYDIPFTIPIQWTDEVYKGLGGDGVSTDRVLFDNLFQPPTTAINIIALEHYDFDYLSQLPHLDKNPTSHMGHLILLDLAAYSSIVSLHQFIYHTHHLLAKGCLYPLLDVKVTVLMMNSERMDSLHLQPHEIETQLHEAGFHSITLLHTPPHPHFLIYDEYVNDPYGDHPFKVSSDGNTLIKTLKDGQDVELASFEAGYQSTTTISLSKSHYESSLATFQDKETKIITSGDKIAVMVWDDVLQEYLRLSQKGYFTNYHTHLINPSVFKLCSPRDFPVISYRMGLKSVRCEWQGQGGLNLFQQAIEFILQDAVVLAQSKADDKVKLITDRTELQNCKKSRDNNQKDENGQSGRSSSATSSSSSNSSSKPPSFSDSNELHLSTAATKMLIANMRLPIDPRLSPKTVSSERLVPYYAPIFQHFYHKFLEFIISDQFLTGKGIGIERVGAAQPSLSPSLSSKTTTSSTSPTPLNPAPINSDLPWWLNLPSYYRHRFAHFKNPIPYPLKEHGASKFSNTAWIDPYHGLVKTDSGHHTLYHIQPPPNYPKPCLVGDNVGQQTNSNNTFPNEFHFESFLMFDNRVIVSDSTSDVPFLQPLGKKMRDNINSLMTQRIGGNGIVRRFYKHRQNDLHKLIQHQEQQQPTPTAPFPIKIDTLYTRIQSAAPRLQPPTITTPKSLDVDDGGSSDNTYLYLVQEVYHKTKHLRPLNKNENAGLVENYEQLEFIDRMKSHRNTGPICGPRYKAIFDHVLNDEQGEVTSPSISSSTSSSFSSSSSPTTTTSEPKSVTVMMTYHNTTIAAFTPSPPPTTVKAKKTLPEFKARDHQQAFFPHRLGSGLAFCPLTYLSGVIIIPFVVSNNKKNDDGTPSDDNHNSNLQQQEQQQQSTALPIPSLFGHPQHFKNALTRADELGPMITALTPEQAQSKPNSIEDWIKFGALKEELLQQPTFDIEQLQSGLTSIFGSSSSLSSFLTLKDIIPWWYQTEQYRLTAQNPTPFNNTVSIADLDSPLHFVVVLINPVEGDVVVLDKKDDDDVGAVPAPSSSSPKRPTTTSSSSKRPTTTSPSSPQPPQPPQPPQNIIHTITQSQFDYLEENVPPCYFNQITTQIFGPLSTCSDVDKVQHLTKVDFIKLHQFESLFESIERDSVDIRLEMYRGVKGI
jgi:hypothetical protein